MKKIVVTLFSLGMFFFGFSQGINFQGVARSANGTIIAGSNVSLRLSIISKNVDATPEYVETKTVMTNAQGIFSIVVGDGSNTAVTGNFKNIVWSDNPKFLKVEMDPAGGTNYLNMGATQLQYVPYSFYSYGVDASNVKGIVPVKAGGTGVATMEELKTALNIVIPPSVDTNSLSNRINGKLSSTDTVSLSNRINQKADYVAPGVSGNYMISNGNGWVSTKIDMQALNFSYFKVDSTNTRFQLSSLSKLEKRSTGATNNDSTEIARSNYAWYNLAIGDSSLSNVDSGSNNIAIGYKSLIKNKTGNSNTSVGGYGNLNANTTGFQNNAIGSSTMNANTTGNRNNSFGTLAMNAMTTGFANSAFGNASLMSAVTGNENSSFGRMSTLNLKAGSFNSAFGNQTLVADTLGDYNTALGYRAGAGLRNGSKNIFIGNAAGSNTSFSSVSNRLVIDNSDTTKPLIYGELDNNKIVVNGELTANSFKVPGGTSAQYLRADGTVTTSVTAGVPYSGASQAVNLGAYDLTVNGITVGIGAGTSTSSSNTAFGKNALSSNTTGSENTAIGHLSQEKTTTGKHNTSIGIHSMIVNTTGEYNASIGSYSLYRNVSGTGNTAVGSLALYNTTGGYNVAVGMQALVNNTTPSFNTAIGTYSLFENTTGASNTGIGSRTLQSNTTGTSNLAVGSSAMYLNTSGSNNLAIGNGSLNSNVSNSGSLAIGHNSMYYADNRTTGRSTGNTAIGIETLYGSSIASNNIGYNNTAVGYQSIKVNTSGANNTGVGISALTLNTSGSNNTAIGENALKTNTTGDNNIAVGSLSLISNTVGSNNIAIGREANVGANNLTNAIVIGNNATVSSSNSIQLGNSDIAEVKTSGIIISNKGFLPPKILASERDAIVNPQQALIIFCKNCGLNGQMQFYSGSTWVDMVGNAPASVLEIGSSFQGGKIAYLLQNGDPGYDPNQLHGIISSTIDQTINSFSGYFTGTGVMWQQGTYSGGTTIFDVTNANGTALGTGRTNTDLIIAKQSSTGRSFAAASLAVNYNGGGYTDWYLPSKDELYKMYLNRLIIGNFESNWYWSSTEKNDAYAEALNFGTGNFDGIGGYKGPAGTPYKVRAIRKF